MIPRSTFLYLSLGCTVLLAALTSCEVVLWQEPAVAETSRLHAPEWTVTSPSLTPAEGSLTVTGKARPSGLARYEGSTPGSFATLTGARIRWEDGTETLSSLLLEVNPAPEVWPQQYLVTVKLAFRPGNTWLEAALEDSWGYRSPWQKITLSAGALP